MPGQEAEPPVGATTGELLGYWQERAERAEALGRVKPSMDRAASELLNRWNQYQAKPVVGRRTVLGVTAGSFDEVPTLEGLAQSLNFQTWTVGSSIVRTMSAGFRQCLYVSPGIASRVLYAGLVFDYTTIAASDTAYWKADLQVGSGGTWTTVATKTTQVNGALANGGITARVPWTFESANWSGSDLTPGQVLAINWSAVGGPPDLKFPMTVTFRAHEL